MTDGDEAKLSSRLPRSFDGYDCAATDLLLKEFAGKQAELERERDSLQQQIARLEADLARQRNPEQLLSKTLLSATSYAMRTREDARNEAELILKKARAEAAKRRAVAKRAQQDRNDAERASLGRRGLK